MFQPAPPLPTAAPLTAEAAERWHAARAAHRWDSRWLVLLPVALFVLVAARADGLDVAGAPRWYESADVVLAALVAQALALLARPRGLPLTALALIPVGWYVPGVPDELTRWALTLAQAALAALLITAALGRQRARQQLTDLMGPEVPYPWTAAGQPSPFAEHPVRPVGRRVVGLVLLGPAVTAPLFDPSLLVTAAGVGGTGVILLASAAKAVRVRHSLTERPGAPAVRVLFQFDGGPKAGPFFGGPRWELTLREQHTWADGRWGGEGVADEDDEDEDDDEGETDGEEAYGPVAGPPLPALLYQGPDGPYAQLLVLPPEDDPGTGNPGTTGTWTAVVCAPEVRPAGPVAAGDPAAPADPGAPAETPTVPMAAGVWEMPRPLRLLCGPAVAVLLAVLGVLRAESGWWSGLLQPLLIGGIALVGVVSRLGWQAAVDRDGVTVSAGLARRRAGWEEITAATAEGGRLSVTVRDAGALEFGGRVASWFGVQGFDAAALAAGVGHATRHPELRPRESRPGPLGHPDLLVNRISLTAYLVFTVLHFLAVRGGL
ncbi:hypothetical protein ACFVYP_37070 [Kitasatospora sp. NPDC058201]|uniref:hypothetical protein n=1 Tax=unclassified Kitasatospora TaxID=2633591 RepID=UPI003658BAE3